MLVYNLFMPGELLKVLNNRKGFEPKSVIEVAIAV
jgi:hypothetical protein